jgi:peptidoglycan/xylan/chitin deacetylase (PgdA/CDA1 family)
LTIDDCNSSSVVQAYLDLFARERVNATFFPIGSVVAANPSLWRRVASSGFPVANHSWSHPNLTNLSQAAIETEIRRAGSAIQAATGRAPLAVMRPPGGSWNQTVLRAAARTGQAYVVLWDVSAGDTGRGTTAQVAANAMRGTSGSIILFHANETRSVEAMALVIDHYRSEGYGFVTLGQLLGLSGPVPYPASQAGEDRLIAGFVGPATDQEAAHER